MKPLDVVIWPLGVLALVIYHALYWPCWFWHKQGPASAVGLSRKEMQMSSDKTVFNYRGETLPDSVTVQRFEPVTDGQFIKYVPHERTYVAVDALHEWIGTQDGPTIWALKAFINELTGIERPS